MCLCLCCRDESQSEMIADESATKPEGWLDDEPELIPDPDAEKPDDWWVLRETGVIDNDTEETLYNSINFC